jgi:transglutaminase-like putative cysteine protease
VALYLGHRSSLAEKSDVFLAARRPTRVRSIAMASVAILPLALVLFMLLPRLPAFIGNYLPMSPLKQSLGGFEGLIKNPGYTNLPDQFPSNPLPFNPDAYQGFNRFLDLRVRGVPSKAVLMKVRSSEATYWRATAFDKFLGNGWENTDKTPVEISSNDMPLGVDYPNYERPRLVTHDLVQTFFIQRSLPNTVFAAFTPRDIYFPTHFLKVDSMMTVMTPLTLEKGLIYTVVSEVNDATPDELRTAKGMVPPAIRERYCAPPPISPGVAGIARALTSGQLNDYDRVTALSEYLRKNFTYDLNCPPQGKDENTVEYFLREKRGFCEHFATTLAVMCRCVNIPSRLAVGFDTGELNPLTGYYDVTASDAHAWVEVFFPQYGWIQFDPTPGSSDVYVRPTGARTWSGFDFLRYVGRGFSKVFPASWGRAVKGALSSVGRWLRSAVDSIAYRWRGIAIAAVALALLLCLWLWLRRLRTRGRGERTSRDGRRQRAADIFLSLADLLASRGYPRRSSQTPLEYADEVERSCGVTGITKAARLFTGCRFSRREPTDEELNDLEAAVGSIQVSLTRVAGRGGAKPPLRRIARRTNP